MTNETREIEDVVQSVDSNQPSNSEIESTEADHAQTIGISVQATSEVMSSDSSTEIRVSWKWEDLEAAQRADPEIGPIVGRLLEKPEQPPWDSVTLKSSGTKTLRRMWSHLSIRDGVLKKRFAEVDDSTRDGRSFCPTYIGQSLCRSLMGNVRGSPRHR